MASYTPKYLILGEILRPHGIRGELRMRILTDYPERIPHLKTVSVGKSPDAKTVKIYTIQHMRMHRGYGLIKLTDIDDRNDADTLRGLMVMVKLEDAVPLDDDEIYLYQLIGMIVVTDASETIGELTDVLETGANDVYIVKSPTYGEVLIPVTDETILDTDVDGRIIIVALPEGLLPEA
jgi:16S rRNA processing protein RimM